MATANGINTIQVDVWPLNSMVTKRSELCEAVIFVWLLVVFIIARKGAPEGPGS